MGPSRLFFEHWQIQLRPTCSRYSLSPDFGQKIFLSCYRDQLRPRTRRAAIAFLRATPFFAKCAMTNIRAVLLEDHPQIYCGRYYSYNIETIVHNAVGSSLVQLYALLSRLAVIRWVNSGTVIWHRQPSFCRSAEKQLPVGNQGATVTVAVRF
ncbi:hypothetical protein C8R44DRAFT_749267 [Mycena epipterygia]|nr:hypothetical protein C8R44DRAFT_749267 [Mycena epipterygia]